jgi:hypothetical protein
VRTVSSELSAVLAISFGTVDSAVAKVVRPATVAAMTAGSMVSLAEPMVSLVVALVVSLAESIVSMVSLSMTVVTTVSDIS